MVEFLEYGLANQYDQQTPHFKDIVTRDNKLMPFYIALLGFNQKLHRKESLNQVRSLLQGSSKDSLCNNCGYYFADYKALKAHNDQGSCKGPNANKILLTLTKDKFLCQFGCS